MKSIPTSRILLLFFIIFTLIFMSYYLYNTPGTNVYNAIHHKSNPLPILGNPGHHTRPFSFINQEGQTITEKEVAGKIRVVEYFFTTCKGICPKMNEQMSRVYQAYKGDASILILSHTVDPYKDTVNAMKQYSLRFEADPKQWIFLTGDKKALYDAARYSYLVTAAEDTAVVNIEDDFIHTDRFVLIDRKGLVRGQYSGTDSLKVNQLIKDIELLKSEE